MQAPTSPWWARGMPIPTGVTERLTAPSAEFLLALPSGSLVVDEIGAMACITVEVPYEYA